MTASRNSVACGWSLESTRRDLTALGSTDSFDSGNRNLTLMQPARSEGLFHGRVAALRIDLIMSLFIELTYAS